MDPQTLLAAMRRELDRLQAIREPSLGISQRERLRAEWAHARNAKRGLLKIDLTAWLGREPSASERRSIHRTLDRLESTGEITRIGLYGASRATHVTFPTPTTGKGLESLAE